MDEYTAVTPSPLVKEAPQAQIIRVVRGAAATTDHLRTMLFQERTLYPACKDYLNLDFEATQGQSDRVSESWRRKLCEWIFEVVDHFSFDREVVSVALYYLDRVSSKHTEVSGKPVPKRQFQLIAVTSLYIAIKLHGETDAVDGPRLKLRIAAFEELSRGHFKVETIEAMELSILGALQWRVNPPTNFHFLAYFLRLLPQWSEDEYSESYESMARRIFDIAKYLNELSVCLSTFTFHYRPSTVAYASILCAIDTLHHTLPYEIRVQFLNNIAAATETLTPGMHDVAQAKSILKNLCPDMFPAQNPSGIGGAASPVCVREDQTEKDERSQRKRVRTSCEGEGRSADSV
jgi:lipoyl(octanoyl) transferase